MIKLSTKITATPWIILSFLILLLIYDLQTIPKSRAHPNPNPNPVNPIPNPNPKKNLRNAKKSENKKNGKDNILAFVGILSLIPFKDRRDSIRDTWGAMCRENKLTVCKFIVDGLDNTGKAIPQIQKKTILKESGKYNDIVILKSLTDWNFLHRLFKIWLWVDERYNFEFFVRIDDDQYLCFDRLMYELPHRRDDKNLYWGYQHCEKGSVRIDPGILIVGSDLFQYFMERKETLRCTKFEDVGLRIWMDNLLRTGNITWFPDYRIYHNLVSKEPPRFFQQTQICHEFLSLHGSYVKEMRLLHDIWLKEKQLNLPPYEITSMSLNKCSLDMTAFSKNDDAPFCVDPPQATVEKTGRRSRR